MEHPYLGSLFLGMQWGLRPPGMPAETPCPPHSPAAAGTSEKRFQCGAGSSPSHPFSSIPPSHPFSTCSEQGPDLTPSEPPSASPLLGLAELLSQCLCATMASLCVGGNFPPPPAEVFWAPLRALNSTPSPPPSSSPITSQCPTFKREADATEVPEPFAAEAKFFTESRLLQRDVQIVLESCHNQNILGTILHPASGAGGRGGMMGNP